MACRHILQGGERSPYRGTATKTPYKSSRRLLRSRCRGSTTAATSPAGNHPYNRSARAAVGAKNFLCEPSCCSIWPKFCLRSRRCRWRPALRRRCHRCRSLSIAVSVLGVRTSPSSASFSQAKVGPKIGVTLLPSPHDLVAQFLGQPAVATPAAADESVRRRLVCETAATAVWPGAARASGVMLLPPRRVPCVGLC